MLSVSMTICLLRLARRIVYKRDRSLACAIQGWPQHNSGSALCAIHAWKIKDNGGKLAKSMVGYNGWPVTSALSGDWRNRHEAPD